MTENEYKFPDIEGDATATRRPDETYAQLAERRGTELGIKVVGPLSLKADSKKPQPKIHYPEDAIPDVEPLERSEAQIEMDRIIGGIDVLDAYDMWIGKNRQQRGGRDHNIMVSCPMPHHADSNPSASVSFRKNDDGVWSCHKCDVGGDKYDLAAIHYFGSMDDYKNKEKFPELRQLIAEEFGYRVVRSGKSEWLEQRASVAAVTPPEAGSHGHGHDGENDHGATEEVTNLSGSEDPPASEIEPVDPLEVEIVHPTLDWRNIKCIEPGTFLHEWLTATSHGDEPEEFYLGLGLQALAAAVGNAVTLNDDPLVRPNLLMSLVGSSGTGKSIAVRRQRMLLREAFPWSMQQHTGVKMISGAGSGEELVSQFDIREADPNGGPAIVKPVNGVFDEDEMATLAARMRRPGATMRQYIMQMFDSSAEVTTSSRTMGSTTARDHFFQLITTTQPLALKDILSHGDTVSGYLNRWLYIFGNVKTRRAIRQAGTVDIMPCVPILKTIRSWSAVAGGRMVEWSNAAARTAFEDYFHNRIVPVQSVDDAWMVQRLDLMAKKICLLLAINDRATTVFPEHVESMKVILEWLMRAYGVVEDQVGSSSLEGEAAELIIEMVQKDPAKDWTIREMKLWSRRLKKIDQQDGRAVVNAIRTLTSASEILEVKSSKTTRYTWNDQEEPALATVTPIALKTT